MDRLDAMHLFVRVAELGSFAAVAQQMGVARSVVTRQIAGLENHLGVKLMVRSTRHLSLTSAGTAYLEKCRVILNLVEAAETDVAADRQTPRGQIRISLPLSFGIQRIAPALLDFCQRFPEISLDMDYTDNRVKLIEDGIDISIRVSGRLEPGDVARKLGTAKLHLIASADYLARHGCPLHPKELSHHECLGYVANGSVINWRFMIDGQLETISVRSRINANNGEVLTEAVALGLGISLQPDFVVAPFIEAGRVQTILDHFLPPELGVYALLPSNRQVPHRVRVLMEFLAEHLQAT